jgi:hypothetical protein
MLGWEFFFKDQVTHAREQEMRHQAKLRLYESMIEGLNTLAFQLAPTLLLSFYLLGNELDISELLLALGYFSKMN